MEKQSFIQIGGSLERATQGDYSLDVKSILKEGWQKTQQNRISINAGLVFVLLLGMSTTFLLTQYFGGFELVYQQPNLMLIIQLVITIVIWPFLAGVEMMGVLHSVNAKTHVNLIFAFLKRASWVIACALFTSVFISIGLQLLIIPGIFLAVAFSLTIPLVVEKKLSPMKAMIISIQALRFQWFKLFTIYFAITLCVLFAMLPFLLLAGSSLGVIGLVIFIFALSYIAPLFYNVKGILYREIFGITLLQKDSDDSNNISHDDVFLA